MVNHLPWPKPIRHDLEAHKTPFILSRSTWWHSHKNDTKWEWHCSLCLRYSENQRSPNNHLKLFWTMTVKMHLPKNKIVWQKYFEWKWINASYLQKTIYKEQWENFEIFKKADFFKNFCFWLYVTTGYTTVSLSKSNILTMTQSLQITSFAAVEKHLTTDMLGWPETEPLVLTGQLKLLQ